VQWKEYGVRVNFKPTILDEQHIKLELEPEVSTLDYTNAARLNGFLIPALRVRRAKTGIELQDGQSFGIAGLLDNNETKAVGKIPVLGDVPILGELFKSKSFQRNETELVFIVTAKLTKPINPDAMPRLREVDGLRDGSPLGVETPKADGTASEMAKPAGNTPATAPAGTSAVTPAATPALTADDAKQKASVTEEPKEEPKTDETPRLLPLKPQPSTAATGGKGVAMKRPAPSAYETLFWTLTPPPELKTSFGRALMADLNFALPMAPVTKTDASQAAKP
jgi:pilus assembly protein CpaC